MSNIKEFLSVTTLENSITALETNLTTLINTTTQGIRTALGMTETQLNARIDAQTVTLTTSIGNVQTALDSIEVTSGTPLAPLANSDTYTSSTTWTSTFTGTLYVTAVAGGGGGAGATNPQGGSTETRVGGRGGSSGSAAYRIPINVQTGDAITLTVGAGGTGGPHSPTTNPSIVPGGNGGDTVVENTTAITANRLSPLSNEVLSITCLGGRGGPRPNGSTSIEPTPSPGGSSLIPDFTGVGEYYVGGEGGDGIYYSGSNRRHSASSGRTSITGITSPTQSSRQATGGGAGQSIFAVTGQGNGGQGGLLGNVSTVWDGIAGSNGLIILEYN